MKLASSKVHFIGIGGIGMCGLAELLHNMGAKVTGSDLSDNLQIQRLKSLGIPVMLGHDAAHVENAEVVVFSSAVKESNPEYIEARKKQIPLIRRAEALAELMRLKRGIAVGGTHGKTTTTSLIASVFLGAGWDPTIVVGGRLEIIQSTAQLGQGDWLVAEADESDGSFNRLAPELVVITNIDNDHLDHYGSFQHLKSAFLDFASRIPFYGAAIVCGDDPNLREIFSDFPKRKVSYGFAEDNDVCIRETASTCQLVESGKVIAEFTPPLPGQHNILNSTAALLAARSAGMDLKQAIKALSGFRGVDRRFQHKGKASGIDFYDDYGHHPTEVSAVLSAFKKHFPDRRKVVLFQPHRYSRTQICWDQFLTCFGDADEVFVMDIYPAGEAPIPGIETSRLIREIQGGRAKQLERDKNPNLEGLSDVLRPGDVFISLGAGDVYKFGERLLKSLEAKQKGGSRGDS